MLLPIVVVVLMVSGLMAGGENKPLPNPETSVVLTVEPNKLPIRSQDIDETPNPPDPEMEKTTYYYALLESELSPDDYLSFRVLDKDCYIIYATNIENVKSVVENDKYSALTFEYVQAKYSRSSVLPVYDELNRLGYCDSPLVYLCAYDENGIYLYVTDTYPELDEYIAGHPQSDMITTRPFETYTKTNPN